LLIEECSITTPFHDDHLIKEARRKNDNRSYLHFHPSSFGGCLRKIALQYYGDIDERFVPPISIEPTVQRMFDAGNAFHWRMQRDLAVANVLRGYWKCRRCEKTHGKENKIGILIPEKCECGDGRKGLSLFEYRELEVEDKEYNFKGNADGIIDIVGSDIQHYVVDFKTIKTEKFNILRKPDVKYIVQINIYMWLLGLEFGIIYYEDKNDHSVKEFLVRSDERIIDNVKENAKKLLYVIKNKKLPSIPTSFSKKKYPCMYCEYCGFLCWKEKY
jgi:hypothetical protein